MPQLIHLESHAAFTYNWDELFNGDRHILTRGDDYHGRTDLFRINAHINAKSRDLRIQTWTKRDPERVIIQRLYAADDPCRWCGESEWWPTRITPPAPVHDPLDGIMRFSPRKKPCRRKPVSGWICRCRLILKAECPHGSHRGWFRQVSRRRFADVF